MPKLVPMTPKKLLKLLEKNGFTVDHVTGSHYILYNETTKKRVTVAYHAKELLKGTLATIIKEAGISDSF